MRTDNNMIHVGQPIKFDEDKFLSKLDILIKASFENGMRIKELTEDICETYRITDN